MVNLPGYYNTSGGSYSRRNREPWILATNLPKSYNATKILNYYKKRMQIEESFRDIKSTQYGLGARFAQTKCINRWGVKMLLAAIVQIVAWIIGIVGHSLNYQKKFQPNTVKNGIKEYLDNSNNDINIYNFPWKIDEISSITLIGCGTAYHSCLMAKYWFEELTSLDVNVDIASEFRYRKNRFKKEN